MLSGSEDLLWYCSILMNSVRRHFLGWDKPFLQNAAKWLQENYLQAGLGSKEQLFILVSGQAVARRLQSYFVAEANQVGRAIELPIIETTTQFFRRLIPKDNRIADQTTLLLATTTVLKGMPPNKVASIVGSRRPSEDDFFGWSRIAKQVLRTFQTASGGGLSFDTSTWPKHAQLLLTEYATERFSLLREVQSQVQQMLEIEGTHIFNLQQLQLLLPKSEIEIGSLRHVVVAGCSDLLIAATKLLDRLLDCEITVDLLIRAPETNSGGFDEYGCIDSDYWIDSDIDIADEDIIVAGSPSSQSAEVVRILESIKDVATSNQITIATTNEQYVPIIQRHLHGHGIRSRFAGGMPLLQTSEALLMSGIMEFVSTGSYGAYAAFVRHPDIVSTLHIKESALEKLSRYSTDVVPSRIGESKWFEPKEVRFDMRELHDLHTQVVGLCRSCIQLEKHPSSIVECSSAIRAMLLKVYGGEVLDHADTKLKILHKIFGVLDRFDSLSKNICKQINPLPISSAIRFMLGELEEETIHDLPDPNAVNTVGWLEAVVSDTPELIVVGMSADLVGGSNPIDSFFPDTLRSALGLETIDRRMARDSHAIIAMHHTRKLNGNIKWIVGRKNNEGNPLSPSPLLMRCSEEQVLAKRAGNLVVSFDREKPEVPPPYKLDKEGRGIQIPTPADYSSTKRIEKLSVTAFKDYLSCPYRFWLKHVLKLNIAEDGNTELDAKLFGSFVHNVLQRFGENDLVNCSTDINVIESALFDILDCVVKDQLGSNISNAIGVQLELARYRLSEFAKHQALSAAGGWKILCTEKLVKKKLDIGDTTFTVRGVIDRVEVHDDGRVRVLDYKTGSTTANKAHFKKDHWIDLQLPLYRELLPNIPELKKYDTGEENVSLGYFKVGDQESSSGIDLLIPTSVVAAILQDTIDGTIKSIMNNEFGNTPTLPAPKYSSNFSWICQDNSVVEESSDDNDD